MDKLRGTGVALVTPFTPTPDCAVDFDALRRLVDFTLEGGVEYLVINGTTAESPTLTIEEKAEILPTACRWCMALGETIQLP
jgi:4-hydroxy-tetrahydrodipicolinate synthase